MDQWIAEGIEDDVRYGGQKRRQYNILRCTTREQQFGVNNHTVAIKCNNSSLKEIQSINNSELMDIDTITIETTEPSTISTSPWSQQIEKRSKIQPLCGEDDDSDNDHGPFILDAYDPLISSEASDSEDKQEQQPDPVVSDQRLHLFTCQRTTEVCKQLMGLFQDSNVSKAQAQRHLSFIQGTLPTPNLLPNSNRRLLSMVDFKKYSNKRVIWSLCGVELDLKRNICLSCPNFKKKHLIFIYGTHFITILTLIVTRLFKDIQDYKEQILKFGDSNTDTNQAYDIPFATTYQNLLRKYRGNFFSLLFHGDGISLCKSTKLKMWLFSSFIIELPSILRYCR